MSEILGKIGFDWHVALANLVNFLIILFLLKKFAWEPIGKMIRERKKTIETGLLDAKQNAEFVKKSKLEYEETLSKARIEANKIFQDGKKEVETKKSAMLEEAKSEVASILENGKKSLQVEKTKMIEEVKKEIVDLAMKATEKLMSAKQDLNNL